MRALVLILLAAGCTACTGAAQTVDGAANYDAMRNARAACEAKGGELSLRPGENPERLDNYICRKRP